MCDNIKTNYKISCKNKIVNVIYPKTETFVHMIIFVQDKDAEQDIYKQAQIWI